MAICILLFFLLSETFVVKDRSFRLFTLMLALCFLATCFDQIYLFIERDTTDSPELIFYLIKALYHLALFTNMFVYLYYLSRMMLLPR